MGFLSVLVLAIGLTLDAMAVSAARGLAAPAVRARDVALVALLFGGFHAGMPLLGWLLGSRIGVWVAAWDHWTACALLVAIGAKMVHEAWKGGGEAPKGEDVFRLRPLLVLAVATSIDAFAVGITLRLLKAPLGLSLLTIGLTAAVLSAAGLFAGRRFGSALGRRLGALGGVVLVAQGVKILVDHLTV
jgi:putative Mn2+ efflux pump MntP